MPWVTAPVLRFFLNKFAKTLRLPKDNTRKLDLLAKICGGMQVTIEKLSGSNDGKHVISQVADKIMTLLPKVFIYKFRSSTLLEKAMLAIGALARATGPEFRKYMQEFYQHLETGLDNMTENNVCSASVEVASDICRALGYRVLPFCSDLVPVLFRNLCSRKLHRSAKPLIFSCFGDIALAIGIYFEEHVRSVMPRLSDAADECAQRIDREYGKQLKRSVLKAYSAILQGCKRSKPEILEPHAPQILKFVEVVVTDANNRYVCMYVCVRACVYVSCMHACVRVRACVHACMYVCITFFIVFVPVVCQKSLFQSISLKIAISVPVVSLS
ncbi:putative armadillo-like helical, importin beta family [Helianthus annuus]|nr:putative armadillo-like helical, importin beta family [Helianthus annuus]